MTLGALCVFPVLAAFVIYKLGSLPGSIAQVMRITSWTNYLFFSA